MTQQAGNSEISAGVNIDYNLNDNMKVVIGTWYRRSDAIAFMVGVEQKMFTFGYSYDAVTSSLNNFAGSAAAHEITLSYKLHKSPNEKLNPFNSF